MIIRIDSRKLMDDDTLHTTLSEAFGLLPSYGKNLDALVDCLTHLDDPKAGLSRTRTFPGQVALLAIEHVDGLGKPQETQLKRLVDVVAFVNWRRMEKGQAPVLAVAYGPG